MIDDACFDSNNRNVSIFVCMDEQNVSKNVNKNFTVENSILYPDDCEVVIKILSMKHIFMCALHVYYGSL